MRPIAHLVEILAHPPQFRRFPQDFHSLGRLTLILPTSDERTIVHTLGWGSPPGRLRRTWTAGAGCIFIHEVGYLYMGWMGGSIDLGHWPFKG
jgi:hypothetical protein